MGASRAASAPQRGAIVVELYVRQAVSARQISKITGIPRPEVTSLLRAAGIEMAPRGLGRPRTRARQQFPKRLDAQLSELYVRRRLTRKVVAHALGLSEWMIRRRLAELGVPMRSRGGWYRENRSEPDPDEIFRLYLAYGWSANLVGAQLGISRKVVLRTVHEHGWPVKIGGPPPRGGPEEIALVRALYEDGLVARVPPGMGCHRGGTRCGDLAQVPRATGDPGEPAPDALPRLWTVPPADRAADWSTCANPRPSTPWSWGASSATRRPVTIHAPLARQGTTLGGHQEAPWSSV